MRVPISVGNLCARIEKLVGQFCVPRGQLLSAPGLSMGALEPQASDIVDCLNRVFCVQFLCAVCAINGCVLGALRVAEGKSEGPRPNTTRPQEPVGDQ